MAVDRQHLLRRIHALRVTKREVGRRAGLDENTVHRVLTTRSGLARTVDAVEAAVAAMEREARVALGDDAQGDAA